MKIEIEVKNADRGVRRDLLWFFQRLENVNSGAGVTLRSEHNSGESNLAYLDGDGSVRVAVNITQLGK